MSKRYSDIEMYPLIKKYLQSNKTQVAFCKLQNIKVHTFQYWYLKYKKERISKTDSGEFVPIQIKEPEKISSRSIKVNYPNGTIIEFPI